MLKGCYARKGDFALSRLCDNIYLMNDKSQKLNRITSLEQEAQLFQLEGVLNNLSTENVDEEILLALLGIFERFPWQDGYGICWSILHLIESCPNYERLLVESIKRQPGEFNLTMINRLLNAKIIAIENQELVGLLKQVVDKPNVDDRAKKLAKEFLDYQNS